MSRMFDRSLSEEDVRILPYEPPHIMTMKTESEPQRMFKEPPELDVKKDQGKNRLDLVQPEFMEEIAAAMTFGAEKYPANSWQGIPCAPDRYYAALLRHLFAWRKGERTDKESGLSHLAHAATNLMFLSHFYREGDC